MNEQILWLEIHEDNIMEIERSVLPAGFDLVRPTSATDVEEHVRLLRDADYLITGSIPTPRDHIMGAPKLKLIHKWGVGVDKIDLAAAKERGIPVYITAGANAISVAELAVGLILAVNRKIPYMDRTIRQGKWVRKAMRAECYLLHGKRVGLVGAGNIAREVARILRGFETEVIYYDILRLPKDTEQTLRLRYVGLDELLHSSDVVSLHVPLNDRTRGMIGAQELARMRADAILINTARGFIVDEKALAQALESGQIRGAGIDAFDTEPLCPESSLRRQDNIVLSCHVGGAVLDNVLSRTNQAYQNILSFKKTGRPVDSNDLWQE